MTDEPTIVAARADDVDVIRALTREAYAAWVPLIGREPLPMVADYALALKNNRIDMLYLGIQLAGLIEMISGEDYFLIENVAVLPAYQHKGLGQKLVAHAEHVGLSLGYDEVRLYTNKRFEQNLAFYARLGYGIDHEEDFRGGVIVHMRKALPVSDEPLVPFSHIEM